MMSAGVILAWTTEAQEKGIISDTETMGIKLEWGNYATHIGAVRLIIEQPNEFYKALARGVIHAASIYGGEEYALAFGGNEMPGYHTGPGAHIWALIGARHSHLDNAGYSVDQKILIKEQISTEELVGTLLAEERWRQTLSSLVIGFFARGIYQPDTICKSLHSAGFNLTPEDLYRIGEEIHREKYRLKIRDGFSLENSRLPGRIFETQSPVGKLDEEFIRKAIRICQEEVGQTEYQQRT